MDISSTEFFLLGVIAFSISVLTAWPLRTLAIRFGVLDFPNADYKTQVAPIPYLGGVAIALGVCFATLASLMFTNQSHLIFSRGLTAIIPAIALGFIGLFDDVRPLAPLPRLLLQSVVAVFIATLLINSGTLGTPSGINYLDASISIIWIVGITNSINFLDNLDGAAAGTIVISSFGVFFIAADRGQLLLSVLAIATIGASLGFLIWNVPVAKMYMGDAGSLFLGIIISVMTIRLNSNIVPIWKSISIPIILLSLPLLDLCVAIFSRIARGQSPIIGGRDHISHRLMECGMSRKSTVLVLWSASCINVAIALYFYKFSELVGYFEVIMIAGAWFFLLALFIKLSRRIESEKNTTFEIKPEENLGN